jgi:methionyl-tRNA synthetase
MNRYVTTTLPYINADPHIGFALELLYADVLVRSWRDKGDEVFFSTGTDEHGQKVWDSAQKKGQEIQEYVDEHAEKVQKLKEVLNLSNDAFIRTTDRAHIYAAQEIWRRCEAKGDVYKKSYTGLYCVGCEEYKTQKDLDENRHCLLHPAMEIRVIEEENYFFRLSNYQQKLEDYLNKLGVIIPEWRRIEALNFVQAGLADFSISRQTEKLSWGVPVPGDDTQVMYVWFDALTNYISTLGWPADPNGNFKKFWENGRTLQMAGKDQIRFQSIMWQAMLMSADIKLTDQVFYHGFINSGGQKMSKSLGNVISPHDLVEKYGTEATRYLLLRHVHPADDSDVTWERLDEWYTANLVNGLGNLVARVMKLAETHLSESVEESPETSSQEEYSKALDTFAFNEAVDLIWHHIQVIDESITKDEPFKVVKIDEEKGREMIKVVVRELYTIGNLLQPFMPKTSDIIKAAVRENMKPENLFPRLG